MSDHNPLFLPTYRFRNKVLPIPYRYSRVLDIRTFTLSKKVKHRWRNTRTARPRCVPESFPYGFAFCVYAAWLFFGETPFKVEAKLTGFDTVPQYNNLVRAVKNIPDTYRQFLPPEFGKRHLTLIHKKPNVYNYMAFWVMPDNPTAGGMGRYQLRFFPKKVRGITVHDMAGPNLPAKAAGLLWLAEHGYVRERRLETVDGDGLFFYDLTDSGKAAIQRCRRIEGWQEKEEEIYNIVPRKLKNDKFFDRWVEDGGFHQQPWHIFWGRAHFASLLAGQLPKPNARTDHFFLQRKERMLAKYGKMRQSFPEYTPSVLD